MFKFVSILIILSIFTCQKPEPQRPNILHSAVYKDSLKLDSLAKLNSISRDCIQKDSIKTNSSFEKLVVHYTNYDNQNLTVTYFEIDTTQKVEINFKEKNMDAQLIETNTNSNIYKLENTTWETEENKKSGKLTINGTWFEFVKKE